MFKFVLSGLFLTLTITAARAESPQSLCLQSQSRVEETKCLSKELDKSKAVLSEYVKAAQQQIDRQNAGKPQLAAVQNEWEKYRSDQCQNAYDYQEAGTYRYRAGLECEIEATHSRTHEIWSAYMRTFGTSAPIRPEP